MCNPMHKVGDGGGQIDLSVEVKSVTAAGDRLAPFIAISLQFNKPNTDGSSRPVMIPRILAASIDLYQSRDSIFPWIKTGLIPLDLNDKMLIPLNHGLIEELLHDAETHPSLEVQFYVNIFAMANIDDHPNGIKIYNTNPRVPIAINAIDWQKHLETWGYPVYRFVPISLQLPDALDVENKMAVAHWTDACATLTEAHQEWRKNQVQYVGVKLRDAVQHAIFTWYSLWYPKKKRPKHWLDTVSAIGAGIPGYNKENPIIPSDIEPNAERLLSRLIFLKDLSNMGNSFHHTGVLSVYTKDDVDLLITATTAALRNLPSFWSTYSSPLKSE